MTACITAVTAYLRQLELEHVLALGGLGVQHVGGELHGHPDIVLLHRI